MERLRNLYQKIPLVWRLLGPVMLLVLGGIALLRGRPDGRLHLHFLSVGPGNAILVVTPSGRTALIDGGPDATALLTALGQQLPFWQQDLDVVLLTETASDRLAGPVAALQRFRAQAAGRPGRVNPGPGWTRWSELLSQAGVEPLPLLQGARLELGDGVVLEVLHPGARPQPKIAPGGRDDALVLRLTYGLFSALLPTAAGPAGRDVLLAGGLPLSSTVLLIPRQAGERALDTRFLQAVRPAIAIASAGSGYHQGPDARILALVSEAGCALYRTDRQGTIEVVTDGQEVWVYPQRSGR